MKTRCEGSKLSNAFWSISRSLRKIFENQFFSREFEKKFAQKEKIGELWAICGVSNHLFDSIKKTPGKKI